MTRPLRNTTLYLRGVPTGLVRALKAEAARRGLTLTALAIAALARALKAEDSHASATGTSAPRPSGSTARTGGWQDDLKPLEADMAWYDAHRRPLLRRYAGEYLAIADRRVLDHDADFSVLAGRVFAKVGVRPIFMPQCVADDQVAHLRSPRRVPA